ncbi:carboxylic ester hydrolase [Streptomyces mashuensis]|uniref:Carboxylic ester hydrolase n=1 Tax=Streptomyces mashuensis TaxID=33904 RepID=A0A919B4Q7_9ACTN|nr:carboxylesterase family protein [Streptomyces mashuensis]GHF54658.1 carboxylic ester hydrolase [Streptomyces mashuensis]
MQRNERPVVDTEAGSVRGTVEDGVAAFRGIPYAASPVGDRRFAAPAPHPAWPGVRDAGRPGPSVPQSPSRLEAVMGRRTPDWDEDGCLTLNVWTPALPADASARGALPVLVWFHGGGFTSGSGGWDWYDGRNLAAAGGIVVVTANYRLGPLGFLHLPELGIDNLGVQDQAAVLGWVRRNIAAFGGDPGSVTAGGQSAGAFSALHLAVSPVTGRHVHRVVAQSGPFGLAPQDPGEATAHARRYLGLLGLPGPCGGAGLLAALRAVPAGRLLAAYQQLSRDVSRPGGVAPPMYPVLGAFGVPVPWQRAVADGRLDGKQLLTGTTRDEMTAFFASDPRIRALTTDQARSLAAQEAHDGAVRYDRTAARLPATGNVTPGDVLTELVTELLFRDETLALAGHHAAAGNGTYVYEFAYSPADGPARLGATHCVELPFLFTTFDAYRGSPMLGRVTAEVRALGEAFSRAIAAFVATGRPGTGPWRPYVPGDPATVRHFGRHTR